MNDFILITYSLMSKMLVTPLVLIGLLITSLSLILNLKDTNTYIRKFKEHPNVEKFIKKIFFTSIYLLLTFVISLLSSFIHKNIFLSIAFIMSVVIVCWNLFIIVYTLKEIVQTSLKDDT